MNIPLLKGKIAEKGFTQRDLAKAMNMSKNTINSKLNGRVSFGTEEVEELCEILGIKTDSEKVSIFLSTPSQKWDNQHKKRSNKERKV